MLGDFEPTVHRTTDFLELPRFEQRAAAAELARRGRARSPAPRRPPTTWQRVAEVYATDLALFEELSGIDTSAWPTRLVLDGDLDPGELAARFARKVR